MGIGFTSLEDAGGVAPKHIDYAAPGLSPALSNRVVRPWAELLAQALDSEPHPRILTPQSAFGEPEDGQESGGFTAREVAAFVDLVIADDMEQVRAVADRVIVQTGGREALLGGLLRPAARLLGTMWERDTADFLTVTLGVYRLDQIMKETATVGYVEPLRPGFDNRILLLPVPGEQHSFGVGMVADAFREGGWCVRSGPAVKKRQLVRIVKDEWFDVIGFSVTAERWLKGLPACIRAVRAASCNPDAFVILGGNAVMHHSERTRFLGADAVAVDARDALLQSNIFVETSVTAGLQPFKTRLVDAG